MHVFFSMRCCRRIAILLGATAFFIVGFARSGLAADAITGTWLGSGGQYREHRHTVMENGASIEIRAAENYAFPEYTACRVSSNQLLGRFRFTGTDQNGHRRYEGQWIGWTITSGVCTISEPSGQYTASLVPGRDNFQNPPLQYGPDNAINIYAGSSPVNAGLPADVSVGFVRKSGTSNLQTSVGGGGDSLQPPRSPAPIVGPSLFTYAAPDSNPDVSAYLERSREFVESALDGDYARALRLSGERFKRDIGEKGLAFFRDYVSQQGPAQFIAQAMYDEDGYVVVSGVLALPNRQTLVVHVAFRGGQVEHLFERWGRR